MPKNSRICGNCKHWQILSNRYNDSICLLTHDCFTGDGYSCSEWDARECKRCIDCTHFVSNFAWCTIGNHPAYKCGIGGCTNWQSKERQQMTVTKKMCGKCCENCKSWTDASGVCIYLSVKVKQNGVVHTKRGFCCTNWQARQKTKSNTTIGIDVELNGVDEFKESLESIMDTVKGFASKLGDALSVFNEILDEE